VKRKHVRGKLNAKIGRGDGRIGPKSLIRSPHTGLTALCDPGPPIRWGTCQWEAKGQGRGGRTNRGQGATLLRVCPRRRGPREIRGVPSG